MITADSLFDAGNAAGYEMKRTAFKSLLKNAGSRGLFPEPRDRDKRKRGRPGLWYERDQLQWLDFLFLRGKLDRTESVRLGLWQLGHEVGGDPRSLLAEQLVGIRTLIAGRDLPGEVSVADDVAFGIERRLLDPNQVPARLLLKSTYGWSTRSPYFEPEAVTADDRYWNGLAYDKVTHPAGTITLDGSTLSYPRRDIPAVHAEMLRRNLLSARLLSILGIYTGTADDQQAVPLRGVIEDREPWTLPQLVDEVQVATPERLTSARDAASRTLSDTLRLYDWKPWNSHLRDEGLDVASILRPYQGETRLLFASPALSQLAALLIAQQLAGQPEPDHGLIALALKQVCKKRVGRREQFEAAILMLVAWEPSFEPERRRSRGGLLEPWRPEKTEQTPYERAWEQAEQRWRKNPHWSAREIAAGSGVSFRGQERRSKGRPQPTQLPHAIAGEPALPENVVADVKARLDTDRVPENYWTGDAPEVNWEELQTKASPGKVSPAHVDSGAPDPVPDDYWTGTSEGAISGGPKHRSMLEGWLKDWHRILTERPLSEVEREQLAGVIREAQDAIDNLRQETE